MAGTDSAPSASAPSGAGQDNPPPGTRRWALEIEFDGTGLCGWQRQENGISVQALLETAARGLTGGRDISTATAGRTDAGVHAAGMVVQLDLPDDLLLDARQIRDGLSFHLKPHLVAIRAAAPAPEGWHARFSATWRAYRYTILNRPTRPVLDYGQVWHVRHPMDAEAMQRGAAYLVGRHDFSSFRAAACQASGPVRTLDVLDVHREGDYVIIEAKARSFLHHQVRNLAGSLQKVGSGQWTPEHLATVLRARDRRLAGPTAPPEGLCLMAVGYPVNLFG